ncbi:MAG: hypothetical protein EHM72_06890 [Calditrichaeota bacterium]|nr:MAG: hypothetical protein EHM72_06890 [Calditrichota bacterium]
MKLEYSRANVLRGVLIYTSGDTIAALIMGEFLWTRMAGIMLVAATIYALEIPNYFSWIDRKSVNGHIAGKRTALALLYFNPLWIARHLLFITLFSLKWNEIGLGLLLKGLYSFLVNIPLSLTANYIIQNKIALKWRFTASAAFSALMAIYYPLSARLFK